MRIVYCLDEIEAVGGIERVTVSKANALSRVPGNEVYIVVAFRRKAAVLPVLPEVRVVDLDVGYYEERRLSRLGEMLFVRRKRREHRRRMEAFLNQIRPDVVISTGMSEKHFLPRLRVCSSPAFVRELHFHRYFRRMLAEGFGEKLVARLGEFLDYRLSIRGYDRIVVLTEEDRADNWRGWSKVEVIPNPLTLPTGKASPLEDKVVIAAGRLVGQKDFASLISAWGLISRSHPGWRLRILGDGPRRRELQAQTEACGLTGSVELCGFTSDVRGEMLGASLFVLSSVCEGFGLVILEAMSCGLPVVSYACPCGPRDIICDGTDGFLVPPGDRRMLAERTADLMDDAALRRRMGRAAREKAAEYMPERITGRWMQLFDSLVREKGKTDRRQ